MACCSFLFRFILYQANGSPDEIKYECTDSNSCYFAGESYMKLFLPLRYPVAEKRYVG